jgi:hypothetical protein
MVSAPTAKTTFGGNGICLCGKIASGADVFIDSPGNKTLSFASLFFE